VAGRDASAPSNHGDPEPQTRGAFLGRVLHGAVAEQSAAIRTCGRAHEVRGGNRREMTGPLLGAGHAAGRRAGGRHGQLRRHREHLLAMIGLPGHHARGGAPRIYTSDARRSSRRSHRPTRVSTGPQGLRQDAGWRVRSTAGFRADPVRSRRRDGKTAVSWSGRRGLPQGDGPIRELAALAARPAVVGARGSCPRRFILRGRSGSATRCPALRTSACPS